MDEVNRDKEFAQQVLSGDKRACKQFVEDYTDWVLYKIRHLMKSHCNHSAREYVCCLLFLQQKRKGGYASVGDNVQCDECMDSYIWIFEYLKERLKAYKGINNCSLKTYVWSTINSHSMYIDWLRWRYGRTSISASDLKRLPSIIQGLDLVSQKVCACLRLRKGEEEISKLLDISIEEVRSRIREVEVELIKAGRLDFIKDPVFLSIHSSNPDTPEVQLKTDGLSLDEIASLREFYSHLKETINKLPQHQLHLLRLKYNHKMTAKKIVAFSKEQNISLIPKKKIEELKEQDVCYALNVTLRTVINGLRGRYKKPSLRLNNLKSVFEKIGDLDTLFFSKT